MDLLKHKLVGRGATSEVYEYEPGKVVKFYLEGCPKEGVSWEYQKALCAYENHLPVPRVYDLIEYKNRYGYVMEYIPGASLMSLINQAVENFVAEKLSLEEFSEQILEYTRLTARLLYEVHRIETTQIDSMNDRMRRDASTSQFLSDEEKELVLQLIKELPEGFSVCHGDPNPNNIIINGDKIIFIDWVNSGYGNPMYDIAEYALLSMPSQDKLPGDTPPKILEFADQFSGAVVPVFLEEYEKLSGVSLNGYERWFAPLLVSKLHSNRSLEEKQIIYDRIKTLINTKQ